MLVIKRIMRERNVSQAWLAREAGINQTSVNRIVNGREAAFSKRGQKIADALGWAGDPADLFKEVEGDE